LGISCLWDLRIKSGKKSTACSQHSAAYPLLDLTRKTPTDQIDKNLFYNEGTLLKVHIESSHGTPMIYRTRKGRFFQGLAEQVLASTDLDSMRSKVNLIFTSPPFPLNTKKKYGNLQGHEYLEWLKNFAKLFSEFLTPDGSIVVELGNSWIKGEPVMSTLHTRALLAFLDEGGFNLCQQFVWHNPARLPTPAQWVNIERIRVKDSFTHLWWMSPTTRPKANNREVLTDYSPSMKSLLEKQSYNAGLRPSEHVIGEESFLSDNKGAIPPNVLISANTASRGPYLDYYRANGLKLHPARMPINVPKCFIKFLTNRGDVILDPFAGSNTTGAAAERLGRCWIAIEPDLEYIEGSKGWFTESIISDDS